MINLSPEDAIDLPVDELAMLVLTDLIATNEWNEYNYGLAYAQYANSGYSQNAPALHAIAEATAWLRAHNMIARSPSKSSSEAIFVTR